MLEEYILFLTRDASDAEDLFQEVGVTVMQHATGPDDPARFGAWCRSIARHLAIQRWRGTERERRLLRAHLLDLVDQAYQEEDDSAELWLRRRAAMGDCLARLTEGDRALLRRRYLERVGAEVIGRQMGRTSAAVRMKVMRIRQALARCIEHRLTVAEGTS
jgi:RNA polymerase sigma-70 factor, ECF subfamily